MRSRTVGGALLPLPMNAAGRSARSTLVRAAAILLSLLIGSRAPAAVKLPAVFSHHMVLQRDMAVPIWGWAEPGEEVTVVTNGAPRSG